MPEQQNCTSNHSHVTAVTVSQNRHIRLPKFLTKFCQIFERPGEQLFVYGQARAGQEPNPWIGYNRCIMSCSISINFGGGGGGACENHFWATQVIACIAY